MATHTLLRRVLALLILAASAAAQTTLPIPVQVCVPINGFFYQTIFAPQYYTYVNIQPKVKIVGFVETPAPTARGVTLALAQNGSDCYAYIGPHLNAFATAVNSVINSLWMAYSVTATQFTDRVNYPLFSRVIPRVDVNQRAIAGIMEYFQWTHVNILCTDNDDGQAIADGLTVTLGAIGGTTSRTCINQFASYSTAQAVVAAALKSSSRVLFIAGTVGDASYTYGVQAIHTLDPTHSLVVVFAASVCIQNDFLWKTVSGSFCAVYVANSAYDDFFAAYLNRDTTDERRIVGAIPGMKYTKATADNTYGGYNAFAVDATRLVYSALDKYVGIHGYSPPTPKEAIAWTRNQTLDDGFTGPIAIPNGDRIMPATMRILNAGANNVTTFVANFSANGTLTVTQPTVYVLGQQMLLANVPPAVDPPPPTPASQPYWIIAVVVPFVLVLVVAAAFYIRQRQLLAVRPLDPTAPFAVMFIGVKNGDEVRDTGDANAAAAFAHVANGVRAAVRSSGCYEARRVDESTVMVVAKKMDNALNCAAALMVSMDSTDWGKVMCHVNEVALVVQKRGDRASQGTHRSRIVNDRRSNVNHPNDSSRQSTHHSSSLVAIGSSPRLHIGIHYGFSMIDHDESLNTVSYVGAAVKRAAEVADVAVAGQVLVSREAQEGAEAELSATATWAAVGEFERIPAWDTVAPDTATFQLKKFSEAAVLQMRAAVKRAIDVYHVGGESHAQATGSIAAALQRADAGMSQRRIGVVCLHVPSLRDQATDAAKVPSTTKLVEEVTSIAALHRGEVSAMIKGNIYVTVNAGAAASQPVARAAIIALEVMAHLEAQQLSAASAGIAGGMVVVGRPSQGSAFAAFGHAVELAELAQGEAAKHGLKVCAIDTNSYDDLAARLHVVTIDMIPTNSRDRSSRVLAIIGERDSTNGEWLYSVGSANAGADANEHVWQRLSQLETPEAETVALITKEVEANSSIAYHGLLQLSLSNLRARLTTV